MLSQTIDIPDNEFLLRITIVNAKKITKTKEPYLQAADPALKRHGFMMLNDTITILAEKWKLMIEVKDAERIVFLKKDPGPHQSSLVPPSSKWFEEEAEEGEEEEGEGEEEEDGDDCYDTEEDEYDEEEDEYEDDEDEDEYEEEEEEEE